MSKKIRKGSKYGFQFSSNNDPVLDLCITSFGSCPFGCAKDGAPNCDYNISTNRCEPAQTLADRPVS